jgi:hypothetical protein
VFYVSY